MYVEGKVVKVIEVSVEIKVQNLVKDSVDVQALKGAEVVESSCKAKLEG